MIDFITISEAALPEARRQALFNQLKVIEQEYLQIEISITVCLAQDVKEEGVADRLSQLQKSKTNLETVQSKLGADYKMLSAQIDAASNGVLDSSRA